MKRVIIVLIIIIICNSAFAREDLLENIRVSKANEPELNDFLKSVLRHKEDFRWIRNSVDHLRLEQLTRNLNNIKAPDEVEDELNPFYRSSNDEENIFFESKPKRRTGFTRQQSKYRRPINDAYPYIQPNEVRYKRSFESFKDVDDRSFNDDDEHSHVKVLTRSDSGVRKVPGVKIQRNHRHTECLPDHSSHELVDPKDNIDNSRNNNTAIMGEYYFSSPHDLLGISQDLKCDKSRKHNETCVKRKKSLSKFNENHVRPRSSKDDRAIKVNIVDKGKLIKTVEQNEMSNSLVLTFKSESGEDKLANKDLVSDIASTTSSLVGESYVGGNRSLGNSSVTSNFTNGTRQMTNFRRLELSNVTDDTLENIDKILRHDQDSLKNSSFLPAYLKVKKESIDNEEEIKTAPSKLHEKETRMVKRKDMISDDKILVARNHPHSNDDMTEDRQYEEYDGGYAEDAYNNPEQSRSDVNDANYEYRRPMVYKAKHNIRNPIMRERISKDQAYNGYGEKAYRNRRIHKSRYRGSDSDEPRLHHDKRRMRNQQRGRSNVEMKILPNGIEETVTQDPPVNKKNLLEDETEPTSAAEQRELEKKDFAKFGTTSMDSLATEKMLVTPLKKIFREKPSDIEEAADAKYSNLDEYEDYEANLIDLGDKPDIEDKEFHVKPSRDMIHANIKKSSFYDDVETVNNELKSNQLDNSMRHENKHVGRRFKSTDVPYSEEIRKANNADNSDNINRREAMDSHSDEDEYEQSLEDESAKVAKVDTFHRRRILSLPEDKDLKSIMPPFDTDLNYQNGISNAVNIRVKRTEDFDDVSDNATDEDDDGGEYTNLGPKWHYEKKHVIKPKNVIPVDKLVIGAEDTIGLGDIPTCVSKRMDQVMEEIFLENSYKKDAERKTGAEQDDKNKPIKTDSHNDGNLEINENPKDIVETKLKTKEENEFANVIKNVRKVAGNSTSNIIKFKFNDDESEDHEDDVKKYRKEHQQKMKHPHKNAHHSLLDENDDVRYQLMSAGNKKHHSHDHKHKFKHKKFKGFNDKKSNSEDMRDIIILKKDLQNSLLTGNAEQRELRQNLVYDDSSTPGDNIDLPETNPLDIGSANACNDDRNELQIIEKDQAIIFKFSTPKAELDKGMSNSDEVAGASSDSGEQESNNEYCDSGEKIENPSPDVEGNEDEQLKQEESKCGHVLPLVRAVNATFGSKALDKAFGQEAKPIDPTEDGELFDKILGLMSKYRKPHEDKFPKLSPFIQNRSLGFEDDDEVNVNHHLHKDSKVHPPKNKQLVCSKAPKHDENSDDDADSFSQDDDEKNIFFRNSIPSHSMQIMNISNKNASPHALDSVESFSDIVEKQIKAKRTKKHIIDDDLLPSDFDNLTQVEVEEMDDGKPNLLRKKRYLKFLYKNATKLARDKSQRRTPKCSRDKAFIQRGKRRLTDYNIYKNYGDYGDLDYNNYEPKYSRASSQDANQPMQQQMFLLPNNMRYIQQNQNLQSIQNMRNRYDTARKYNLVKNYRNTSSDKGELAEPNKLTNRATTHATLLSKITWDASSSGGKSSNRTNTTKKAGKKSENMKEIMNGQLIMNIIDRFTQKLKNNDVVYKRFGKQIPRKRAEMIVDKLSAYRDQQTKKDIKHAEIMLHQVIIMLNRVVMDQVHRKICMTLSPELHSYLAMITTNTCKGGKITNQIAEGYPLPELRGGNGTIAANQPPPPDDEQGDFLFESDLGAKDSKYKSSNHNIDTSDTASKKIHLIKKLLNKYNNMSNLCQVKVEPVKDYLIEHMEMLEKIKNKELLASIETTTEANDDSCLDQNRSPQTHPEGDAGVTETRSSPKEIAVAVRSSSLSVRAPSSSGSSSTLGPSPAGISIKFDDNSIKVETRDLATPSSDQVSNSDEEDAQEVEAVKQKFIKNYGHGRFYPLSGRYSDPITHFQAELSRENSYKEPYIMGSHPFNLNLDSRPNYLAGLDMNPVMEGNQRNYAALQPEHNSMMLDALKNPLPMQGNGKQRRSDNATYWSGSDKYQKLVAAATDLRRKREIEERIGKLFGGHSAKYKKSYEYKSGNNEHEAYPDLSKVRFETPLIYRVV